MVLHLFCFRTAPSKNNDNFTMQLQWNAFLWYIKKKSTRNVLLAHGLQNAQYLLAQLDFYWPQTTGPGEMSNPATLLLGLIFAPAGILPRGKIPRRHPYSSCMYKVKYLQLKYTVGIYTRSNLDLPEQGAHGISG